MSIPGREREKRGEFCGLFPSDNLYVQPLATPETCTDFSRSRSGIDTQLHL